MKTEVQLISGAEFARKLIEVRDGSGVPHVIGVEKQRVLRCLGEMAAEVRERCTITYYDDEDVNEQGATAYYFAEVREGQLYPTHKTYDDLEARYFEGAAS